ncbi:MAG: hypothetical protein KBD76_03435 [Bacteriovorax sp.]|nr:hypothetical protein [Bacteriovorax sp.]
MHFTRFQLMLSVVVAGRLLYLIIKKAQLLERTDRFDHYLIRQKSNSA